LNANRIAVSCPIKRKLIPKVVLLVRLLVSEFVY